MIHSNFCFSIVFIVSFLFSSQLGSQETAKPDSSKRNIDTSLTQLFTDQEYKTPLAGEALEITIGDRKISIPERDRRKVLAINVGTSLFVPEIGDNLAVPFAAFYCLGQWEDDTRRLRAIFSGFANYLDFADGTWNSQGLEGLFSWENFTIPFPTAEIIEGEEIQDSEIYWGHCLASLGIGWRIPVCPCHADNDFRAQIFYELGYLYIRRSRKTGDDVELPPSTFIHQIHCRVRYDAFDRNILELPHRGWASGLDVILGRRDHWADHRYSTDITFSREDTRDFLRVTSYFVAAFDVPFLSERHRLLLSCHGGWSPSKNWDRFSALRIGGGPNPSESNDLSRHPFPGALFDQFVVENYVLLSLEYRLELFFFLYLHVKGTLGWGAMASLDKESKLTVVDVAGQAFSVGITSGFLWDSSIYIEYSFDNRIVRQKEDGHSVLISWSKEL